MALIVADGETVWSKTAHSIDEAETLESIPRDCNLNSYFSNWYNNREGIVDHMIIQQLWKESEVVKLIVLMAHSGLIKY
jgi:hypothetical protein